MKRKVITVFLALLLCFHIAVCASAAPVEGFIVDEVGYLATEEVAILNEMAYQIHNTRNVGIFFVFTDAEVLKEYDISPIVGDTEHYYLMIENSANWYSFSSGLGENIEPAAEEALRDVYDAEDTYVAGVKAFLQAAAKYYPAVADTAAPETNAPDPENTILFDNADLLRSEEASKVAGRLSEISRQYQAQIVVATIASTDSSDLDAFVESFYDSMALGYGENHDGVLLLVCMDPREYRILSNGLAADAITASEIDAIGNLIVPDLSDGNYAAAFSLFADRCEYYLEGHINGFPFNAGMSLVIALFIGIASGLSVAFVLKGQLKTVRKQEQANVYVKPGSLQITISHDFFLYAEEKRTKKDSGKSSDSEPSRNVGGGSF